LLEVRRIHPGPDVVRDNIALINAQTDKVGGRDCQHLAAPKAGLPDQFFGVRPVKEEVARAQELPVGLGLLNDDILQARQVDAPCSVNVVHAQDGQPVTSRVRRG